jgi:CBS domain-containing protein
VRDPVTVSDDMSLDALVEDVFLTHRHTAYPVLAATGQVAGLVTVRDVLALPRDQWPGLTVRDRMLPLERSLVVDAQEPLSEALRDLARTDVHRALVSDHGHLRSLLSMTDVARTFEVLAGEDIGYLGGTPRQRFSAAQPASAGAPTGNGRES